MLAANFEIYAAKSRMTRCAKSSQVAYALIIGSINEMKYSEPLRRRLSDMQSRFTTAAGASERRNAHETRIHSVRVAKPPASCCRSARRVNKAVAGRRRSLTTVQLQFRSKFIFELNF